ncbi:hypothetical protein ACFLZK_02610 [Patescibacteria group bacterium]
MLFKLKSVLQKWYEEKNVLDILFDVLASVGIAVTYVMAIGDHSFLHEFLAITNYLASIALIASRRPYKYVYMLYIFIIFLIALFTDGFI